MKKCSNLHEFFIGEAHGALSPRPAGKSRILCYNSCMKSAYRGFTLIELLVVIVIIGILSSIILVSLSGSKAKARDGQRVSDLGQIQLALSLYYDRCGQYPPPDHQLGSFGSGGGGYFIDDTMLTANVGCPPTSGISLSSFISHIPNPPVGGSVTQSKYDYYTNSGFGPNPATDYVLHASLEGQNVAQANSFPESTRSQPKYAWAAGFTCYNGSNDEYCLTSH